MPCQWGNLSAHLAVILVNCAYGLFNVLGEAVFNGSMSPVVFAFYREVIAGTLLVTICAAKHRITKVPYPRPTQREWALLLSSGAFGIFPIQVCFVWGVKYAGADATSLVMLLLPCLVLIVAAALGIELLPLNQAGSWCKITGVLCSVGGAVLVIKLGGSSSSTDGGSQELLLGYGFLLLSDFAGVVMLLTQKPLFANYDPLEVISCGYGTAAVCMAIFGAGDCLPAAASCWPCFTTDFAVWKIAAPQTEFSVSLLDAAALAYAVLVCSVMCYYLMTWANSKIDSTSVALYNMVQPIATVVLAYFIEGDSPGLGLVAGAPLIVLGLLLTTRPLSGTSKEASEPEPLLHHVEDEGLATDEAKILARVHTNTKQCESICENVLKPD